MRFIKLFFGFLFYQYIYRLCLYDCLFRWNLICDLKITRHFKRNFIVFFFFFLFVYQQSKSIINLYIQHSKVIICDIRLYVFFFSVWNTHVVFCVNYIHKQSNWKMLFLLYLISTKEKVIFILVLCYKKNLYKYFYIAKGSISRFPKNLPPSYIWVFF